MTGETGSGRKLAVPASGRTIDPLDPDPAAIDRRDVARGLSNHRRFAGQTEPPVNVAQHSVNVARQVERNGHGPRHQLYGLLHDAAEAYIGDVPRPIRRHIAEMGGTDVFEATEERFLDAVWESVGVAPPSEAEWDAVATADAQVLAFEIRTLFADRELVARALDALRSPDWQRPVDEVVADIAADADLSVGSERSREEFLQTYERLEAEL